MSHTFGNVFGYCYLGEGNWLRQDGNIQPVHIRLHSFYGGIKNGRSLTLSIDEGHAAEGGGKYDNCIYLTKQDAIALSIYLMNWIGGNTWEGHIEEHESEYVHPTTEELTK